METHTSYLLLFLSLLSFNAQAYEESKPVDINDVINGLINNVYLQDDNGNGVYKEQALTNLLNLLNKSLRLNSSSVKLHLTYMLALETKLSAERQYSYPNEKLPTYFRRQETRDIVKSIMNSCEAAITSWSTNELLSYSLLVKSYRNFYCGDDLKVLIHDYIYKEYPMSQFLKPVKLLSSDLMCKNMEKAKHNDSDESRKVHKRIVADIRAIATAVDIYYFDHYEFPTNEQGLLILSEKPEQEDNLLGWRKYVKKIKPDPNGNPYNYFRENTDSGFIITIWSESLTNGCQIGIRKVYG